MENSALHRALYRVPYSGLHLYRALCWAYFPLWAALCSLFGRRFGHFRIQCEGPAPIWFCLACGCRPRARASCPPNQRVPAPSAPGPLSLRTLRLKTGPKMGPYIRLKEGPMGAIGRALLPWTMGPIVLCTGPENCASWEHLC